MWASSLLYDAVHLNDEQHASLIQPLLLPVNLKECFKISEGQAALTEGMLYYPSIYHPSCCQDLCSGWEGDYWTQTILKRGNIIAISMAIVVSRSLLWQKFSFQVSCHEKEREWLLFLCCLNVAQPHDSFQIVLSTQLLLFFLHLPTLSIVSTN